MTVKRADPRCPEARALLEQSHALMQSLYPPEHNHYLKIDELCVPEISFFLFDQSGCAALANKGGYAEIKSMFVDPEARGRGIGDALMIHLEQEARDLGLKLIQLETGDTLNAAHELYARHGYTVCEKFGAYENGPHSVFMQKHLD